MNEPLKEPNRMLGIAIPTYKRPEQLQRCLLSVIEAAHPFNVPVYVLDDAGDLTNVKTVQGLQAQYAQLFYIQNETNLGIDRNILKSVDACECRYAWLLGEDDRLVKDSIAVMLKRLERDPDFVYVNYSTVNEDVSIVLREQAIALQADTELSAFDFLADYGWAAGFIGGCVINKTLWANVNQEPYIGTYFAHVGTIFHSIREGAVHIIARPLVLNRCGTPQTFTWQAVTFEVLGGWARLMGRLEPVYGETVCRRARESFDRAHGLNTVKFLLYARAGRAYDMAAYRTHIQPAPGSKLYKMTARAIAHCNQGAVRRLYGLIRWIRRRKGRRITGY